MNAPKSSSPFPPYSTPAYSQTDPSHMSHPSDPRNASRSSVLRQSNDYFFKDGSLNLQADDVHYRVHTYLFERHSRSFVDKFVAQTPQSKIVVLSGVSSHDLDQLLSVLYPMDFQEHSPKTVEHWSAVLALSTDWDFSSIRQLAIEKLASMASSADKVSLGRAHSVTNWLLAAYTDLCERYEPLTMEEGEKLDKADIIHINRVRHEIRISGKAVPGAINRAVARTFDLEYEETKEDHQELRVEVPRVATPLRPDPVFNGLRSTLSSAKPAKEDRPQPTPQRVPADERSPSKPQDISPVTRLVVQGSVSVSPQPSVCYEPTVELSKIPQATEIVADESESLGWAGLTSKKYKKK